MVNLFQEVEARATPGHTHGTVNIDHNLMSFFNQSMYWVIHLKYGPFYRLYDIC